MENHKQSAEKLKLHRFVAMFQSHEATLNGLREHPLQLLRKKAAAKMEKTPFPSLKSENWKYTPVAPIIKPDYVSLAEATPSKSPSISFENLDTIDISVMNGRPKMTPEIKSKLPKGVTIIPLTEAIEKDAFKSFIIKKLNKIIDEPRNTFELMNIAFAQFGVFIHVEKNIILDKTIVFHYVNEAAENDFFTHPQIILIAESGAQVSFLESYENIDHQQTSLTNALHIVEVGENAKVLQYKFQNESTQAHHVYQMHVHQSVNSHFHSYQLDLGGNIVRNNLSTHLEGQNTTTHLLGNYIANGRQSMDNQTFIDHALPHCFSNELYKGIVTDYARAVFNGQVLVRQDAQKTNAFQQNSSLVLSPNAIVDAKPQLEIFADDVKCSHGATIGQLDSASIFYLRSRGLNEQEAKELLQLAFVNEVVNHIDDKNIGAKATALIEKKLAEKFFA